MTDLSMILGSIKDDAKTVQQIVRDTGYTEQGVKAAMEFMILRPKEYQIKTYVSKDGKTYAYRTARA
ncbi:MAG: hypothetical protein RSD95_03750 [Clostridia bacterium]